MIQKIQTNSVSSDRRNNRSQPQFKGMESFLIQAIQQCEQQPMVNVAVLDLATAIVPRTVVEGQTNPYAGLEAFRRESSGLIINCMIPGLIVAGIAKAIENPIMDGSSKMSNCWANEDTINIIAEEFKQAKANGIGGEIYADNPTKAKVYNTLKAVVEKTRGANGNNTVDFKDFDFDTELKTLTEKSFVPEYTKADREGIKLACEKMVGQTHVSEHIKIDSIVDGKLKQAEKYFSQSFEDVMKSAPRILRELKDGKDISKFAKKSTLLLKAKSLGGLAVILPLAIAAQPINRWITAKTSGKKGAPIYKDFKDSEVKELTPKEKTALFKQKLISVGAMVGVAMLSIGKLPGKAMFKSVSQFKSIFPSMDQARLVSTATFASRMMASEDKNDLREATIRDIATFSSFYFLGDYVAKGIATGIQKAKGIKLINELEPLKKDANWFDKLKHWTKNTALKSSSEVHGATKEATAHALRMRSICQLGNIAFSLLSLGLFIPIYNRHKTNKKREAELKNRGVDQKTIDKYYKNTILFASNSPAYNAFKTSK